MRRSIPELVRSVALSYVCCQLSLHAAARQLARLSTHDWALAWRELCRWEKEVAQSRHAVARAHASAIAGLLSVAQHYRTRVEEQRLCSKNTNPEFLLVD